jgi:hypothetical protein
MKTYGIIYNKDPMSCILLLNEKYLDADNFIILHEQNKGLWVRLLKGKLIDPEKVYGISLESLEQFGAEVPNPVPEFTLEELFYVVAKKYNEIHIETTEVIATLPNRKGSTPELMKFNSCKCKMLDKIGKEFRNVGNSKKK